MLEEFEAALDRHSTEVADILSGREMRLLMLSSDEPGISRSLGWKLPVFARCTGNFRGLTGSHSAVVWDSVTQARQTHREHIGDSWFVQALTTALCADDLHSDIPVADFTYSQYPQVHYKNQSWPKIQVKLGQHA